MSYGPSCRRSYSKHWQSQSRSPCLCYRKATTPWKRIVARRLDGRRRMRRSLVQWSWWRFGVSFWL